MLGSAGGATVPFAIIGVVLGGPPSEVTGDVVLLVAV
jgi:hypothetical protein